MCRYYAYKSVLGHSGMEPGYKLLIVRLGYRTYIYGSFNDYKVEWPVMFK